MHSSSLTPFSSPISAKLEGLEPHSLVVEFLGVSGSGKSTLARSLAARLEQQGYRTRLLTMQRASVSTRLLGILYQSGNMCRVALSRRSAFRDARSLMRLFPQRTFLDSARLMQYLLYLFNYRFSLAEDCQVAIFDQGFAQAVYSLALFSNVGSDNEFATALNIFPEPEILITLDVPPDIVAGRLKTRRGLAGVARVTGDDGDLICNSRNIIARIENILRESGCYVIHYCPERSVSIHQSTDYLYHSLWPMVSDSVSARAMAAVHRHQRSSST